MKRILLSLVILAASCGYSEARCRWRCQRQATASGATCTQVQPVVTAVQAVKQCAGGVCPR